ncbi:Scarecrow-like protein 3 [Hibiscus syriacus]|uniref:Scarecrow-like protein 3 n=1 Tax=Hibiscus syriacus TaxID=106335 RepID=A0A6A3ANI4_HIBSY|nr:Scarecrow-like protein 3 [Hibiscus syriacus]
MFEDESSPLTSSSSSPLQVFSMMSLSPNLGSPYPWLRELKSEERGLYLIHLLLTCANHVANGSLENANIALEQISQLATPDGDTMQRMAAYFNEALADRILKAWPGLHKALNSTRITLVSEEILVRKLFFELFPFLKVAFVLTNQAVIEAMEGEKMVHIIDLYAAEPAQWFNPVVSKLENLDVENCGLKLGRLLQSALFSSCIRSWPLMMNTIKRFASRIEEFEWSSLAKSTPDEPETLGELLEKTRLMDIAPVLIRPHRHHYLHPVRRSIVRLFGVHGLENISGEIKVEKMLFGEEIKNIIACEGSERKERHEKLEKWIQRLDLAGFGNIPLSYYGMLHARRLLQGYNCDGYRMKDDNGCVVICWQDRPLFSYRLGGVGSKRWHDIFFLPFFIK